MEHFWKYRGACLAAAVKPEFRAEGILHPQRRGLRNAISLGVFKTEDAANKFLDSVRSQGVKNARYGARTQTIQQTTFVLHDPQPAQAERLQQLKADFAGSEVKIGPCDRA